MTKLIAACCVLAIVCLLQLQDTEGRRSVCASRCSSRCKTLQKQQQKSFWRCLRRCVRLGRNCETCLGPNKCNRCASGYQLSYSSVCVDTDECAAGACSPNAKCTNSIGSYSCSCNSGFSGDGKTCTDVDECATNYGGCSIGATCTNVAGSFTCTCNTGYTGNGTICTGWTLKSKSNRYLVINPTVPLVGISPTEASPFLLLPCLASPTVNSASCFSFMLEYWPGSYLNQWGYELNHGTNASASELQQASFDRDASFYRHTDLFYPGFVAFQSVKFTDRYLRVIRGSGSKVALERIVENNGWKDDASFQLIPRTV